MLTKGLGIFAITFLAYVASAVAGHDVGGGGNSVYCRAETGAQFQGYYALDYLVTYREGADLVAVKSWGESSKRLLQLLGAKSEWLHDSFAEFVELQTNESDYLKPRVWEQAKYGLVELLDHGFFQKLAPNCYEVQGGKKQIIQSVIRKQEPGIIVYQYDPTILTHLKNHSPLQFSFLMVHEWLRDHVASAEALAKITQFLHTESAAKMSPEDFEKSLKNRGLTAAPGFVSVCARTQQIKEFIEKLDGRSCEKIDQIRGPSPLYLHPTSPHNGQIPPLHLQNVGLASLRPGDFSGLAIYNTIVITGNRMKTMPEGIFQSFSRMNVVQLSRNGFEKLYPGTFAGLGPWALDLDGNLLTTLPEKFFSNMSQPPSLLRLDDNRIETLPAKIFCPRAPKDIYLQNNRIHRLPEGIFDCRGLSSVDLTGNPLDADYKRALRRRHPRGEFPQIRFDE